MTDKQLDSLTRVLGRLYFQHDQAKRKLDGKKGEFKSRVADHVEKTRTLARKTVRVVAPDEDEARRRIRQKEPRHRVVEVGVDNLAETTPGVPYVAIVEEDPALVPFAWTNPDDNGPDKKWSGATYQKVVAAGPVNIDLERLRRDDPDLWEAVSDPDPVADAVYVIEHLIGPEDGFGFGDPDVAAAYERVLRNLPEDDVRALRPEEEWTKEQTAALQEYVYEGEPQVKFLKPREATPEELEARGNAD